MLKLEWIKERIGKSQYFYSKHGDQERKNDDLAFAEVEEAIFSGKIVEHYKNEGRGESCLVAGFTDTGKPVHIVFGIRGEWPVIITVYIPRPPKFKTPFERG